MTDVRHAKAGGLTPRTEIAEAERVDGERDVSNRVSTDLVAALRGRAAVEANRLAYAFLADGEQEKARLTWNQLDRRARAVSAELQRRGCKDRPVVLVFYPGLDYVTAFFACLYAGAIAVPTYPPRPNRVDERLAAIAEDAQAALALTHGEVLDLTRQSWLDGAPALARLEWLSVDCIDDRMAEEWTEYEPGPSTIAYLQYTSGSTGSPKGVVVTHENLMLNLEDLDRGWKHTPTSVLVSWLPLFHDLGLIYGVLEPLYVGFSAYIMPPPAFLHRPVRWLQAISRYRATHSAAPNFAFDLCARKVGAEERTRLDLSCWRMALNAAEPVRAETLRRFAETFEECGFDAKALTPGYGLAEATLKVSAARVGEGYIVRHLDAGELAKGAVAEREVASSDTVTLVGCGTSEIDTRVAIVDPDSGSPCPPDRVGEIWVHGRTVARGYWRRPDETRETFEARLGESNYMRTGDLGFLAAGQVFVTGRLKDLIIIRGSNYYPQDIEATVASSHASLRPDCGAAFTIDADGQEQLVVVQEVERTHLRRLDGGAVVRAIRQAVAEAHGLQPRAILLVRPARVPKTSSGKIQRRLCRSLFVDGSLEAVHQWPDGVTERGVTEGGVDQPGSAPG